MFFSPITERSLRVRLIYAVLYVLLTLGSVTMIVPFIVMLSGSVEPGARFTDSTFVPHYLFNREALWQRYLESKYQGVPDLVRMAWQDSTVDFRLAQIPSSTEDHSHWDEFLRENPQPEQWIDVGFIRSSRRLPSYNGREFRLWLLKQYHNDLLELNRSLETQFSTPTSIQIPNIKLIGPRQFDTPLVAKFYEFSRTVPPERKFFWDVSGYYRAVYLPRILGPNIKNFNEKFGTSFKTYGDVPFSATVPAIGADHWFAFVSHVLRPDFVDFTSEGQARFASAGVLKDEFIRLLAKPEDLKIVGTDRTFESWAVARGYGAEKIPQRLLDWEAFQREEGFWRLAFVKQNYLMVLDEVLLQGRAIFNTLVVVVLMVGGALIVNPLAAYALSRFRLRKTYHILLFCLVTIAFPAEVTMIPVFLQLKEFHLLNTFGALVLPGLASGFHIFLLKGFFDSLPKELYEAAELDGASEWTIFWLITMNLSRPILAVIALGAFVTAYGTFFYALILAPDPKMWTIMVYIYQLRQGVDSPVVYASLLISAIPTFLVFVFCQNIILRGIVVPSDK